MRTLILFSIGVATLLLFSGASRRLSFEEMLIGRWQVIRYTEQGVAVDKRSDPWPQALSVWKHVKKNRALTWYGYDEDSGEREPRRFERWQERDSLREVRRVAEAISMPYFAVFFKDSTLALYNLDTVNYRPYFMESKRFDFDRASMSLDIFNLPVSSRWYDRLDVQVIALSERRMTLFIPNEAELVELVKTEFRLP